MLVVAEDDIGLLDAAFALDEDLRRLVDQDVGDRRVLEQRLERPEAEELSEDVADQRLALAESERNALVLAVEEILDENADLGLGFRLRGPRQLIEVQPVEELLVNLALERLVGRRACIGDARRVAPPFARFDPRLRSPHSPP